MVIVAGSLVFNNSALAQQNLVTNPGFTNGTNGWATDCSIEINPETVYGGSVSSNPVAEIDIERCFKQEISVSSGAMYNFSYKASRRQGGTPATVGVTVSITGVQTGTQYVIANKTYTNTSWSWTTEHFSFTLPVNSADTRIRISFSNYITTGTYGTLIDDITLSIDAQSAVLPIGSRNTIQRNVIATTSDFNVYPNPATNTIGYTFNSKTQSTITLRIYNVSGTLLISKQIRLTAGANSVKLDITSLRPGSFYLQVLDNDSSGYIKSFCKK